MRIFDFINNGDSITTKFKDGKVYVDLRSCHDENTKTVLDNYICLYRHINKIEPEDLRVTAGLFDDDEQYIAMAPAQYEAVNFHIQGDPYIALVANHARRPGYQIRGKRLTPEQAFEVIACTDEIFHTYVANQIFEDSFRKYDSFDVVTNAIHNNCIIDIPGRHISTKYLQDENYPWYSGFVAPCGDVGCNYWMYKYPDKSALYLDAWAIEARFPFMEFIVISEFWDEKPPEYNRIPSDDSRRLFFDTSPYVERDMHYCLYAHDGIVEITTDPSKYWEFDSLYEDKRIFDIQDYYTIVKHVDILSRDFVQRMVDYHGLQNATHFCDYLWKCYESKCKLKEEE